MTTSPPSNLVHPLSQCEQMWETYVQAWSTTTNPQRQQLLERCLTPAIHVLGDHSHMVGYDGLQQNIATFQARMGSSGAVMRTCKFRVHHSYGRAQYVCTSGDGSVVLVEDGVDFLEFADDGRICKIVAFLQ